MEISVFYMLAGAATLAALLVVTSRKLVHSALGLTAVALCVALLCAQLGAGLLAAALGLLYAGGIGLAFLLVAAALNLRRERGGRGEIWRVFVACSLGGALLVELEISLWNWNIGVEGESADAAPAVVELSERLFDVFRLHLEVVSLLLLAALVGATLLTRREKIVSGSGRTEG